MCSFTKNVNPVKPGALPDLYDKDEENHKLSGENKNQAPSYEALLERTVGLSLREKSKQVRKVLCVCTALLCFFKKNPESPNPPFTHTLGRYEQATNINIEDHFLLVYLYLCTKGEIYLFQAFKKSV